MNKIITTAMLSLGMVAYAQEGKVGINTISPTATLSVKSKTDTTDKNLELEDSNGTKLLTVTNEGKVGIGIDAPKHSLDIKGGFQFSGPQYFSGEIYEIPGDATEYDLNDPDKKNAYMVFYKGNTTNPKTKIILPSVSKNKGRVIYLVSDRYLDNNNQNSSITEFITEPKFTVAVSGPSGETDDLTGYGTVQLLCTEAGWKMIGRGS